MPSAKSRVRQTKIRAVAAAKLSSNNPLSFLALRRFHKPLQLQLHHLSSEELDKRDASNAVFYPLPGDILMHQRIWLYLIFIRDTLVEGCHLVTTAACLRSLTVADRLSLSCTAVQCFDAAPERPWSIQVLHCPSPSRTAVQCFRIAPARPLYVTALDHLSPSCTAVQCFGLVGRMSAVCRGLVTPRHVISDHRINAMRSIGPGALAKEPPLCEAASMARL